MNADDVEKLGRTCEENYQPAVTLKELSDSIEFGEITNLINERLTNKLVDIELEREREAFREFMDGDGTNIPNGKIWRQK